MDREEMQSLLILRKDRLYLPSQLTFRGLHPFTRTALYGLMFVDEIRDWIADETEQWILAEAL